MAYSMAMRNKIKYKVTGKLGTGARFKKLETALSRKKGIYNPAGLAAYIGRKKLGTKRFQKLAAKGR